MSGQRHSQELAPDQEVKVNFAVGCYKKKSKFKILQSMFDTGGKTCSMHKMNYNADATSFQIANLIVIVGLDKLVETIVRSYDNSS